MPIDILVLVIMECLDELPIFFKRVLLCFLRLVRDPTRLSKISTPAT